MLHGAAEAIEHISLKHAGEWVLLEWRDRCEFVLALFKHNKQLVKKTLTVRLDALLSWATKRTPPADLRERQYTLVLVATYPFFARRHATLNNTAGTHSCYCVCAKATAYPTSAPKLEVLGVLRITNARRPTAYSRPSSSQAASFRA